MNRMHQREGKRVSHTWQSHSSRVFRKRIGPMLTRGVDLGHQSRLAVPTLIHVAHPAGAFLGRWANFLMERGSYNRALRHGWSETWWSDRFLWRIRQYNHQDCLCAICGEAMDFVLPVFCQPGQNWNGASVEHVKPKHCGVSHWDRSNMILSHVRCNWLRGKSHVKKFLFSPCETD
jgi:hypothetical protein